MNTQKIPDIVWDNRIKPAMYMRRTIPRGL